MASQPTESERIRSLYEAEAPRYDRQMRLLERMLFSGGREWVCSQAEGEVLEIAIGTGRNLGHYPDEVSLTGIELSPAMLGIARTRAEELGRTQGASRPRTVRAPGCSRCEKLSERPRVISGSTPALGKRLAMAGVRSWAGLCSRLRARHAELARPSNPFLSRDLTA